MNQFWTPARTRRLGIALLLAFVATLTTEVFFLRRESGLLLRGDFPAFYSAGVIISRGQDAALYDISLQRQVQNEMFPALAGNFLPFAYPPYVAFVASLFVGLGPLLAKFLCAVISCLVLFGSLVALREKYPSLSRDFIFLCGVLALFPPLFVGMLGGQMTPALIASCLIGILLGVNNHRLLAGVVLGVFWCKPQYAALFVLFFASLRYYREGFGLIISGVVLFVLTAAKFGASWLWWWLRAAESFGAADLVVNGDRMVSLRAAIAAIIANENEMWIVYVVTALFVFLFLVTILRKRVSFDLRVCAGVIAPVVVLLSPHALFYDVALGIVPGVLLLDFRRDRVVWSILFLLVLSWGLSSFSEHIPLALYALYLPLALWGSLRLKNLL